MCEFAGERELNRQYVATSPLGEHSCPGLRLIVGSVVGSEPEAGEPYIEVGNERVVVKHAARCQPVPHGLGHAQIDTIEYTRAITGRHS